MDLYIFFFCKSKIKIKGSEEVTGKLDPHSNMCKLLDSWHSFPSLNLWGFSSTSVKWQILQREIRAFCNSLVLVKPHRKFLLILLYNFYIYTRHAYITFILTFLFLPCLYFRLTLETWESFVYWDRLPVSWVPQERGQNKARPRQV